MTKSFILLLLATACGLTTPVDLKFQAQSIPAVKPTLAFTFDDGSINDFGEYKLETWNQQLLNHLKKNKLKAILFSFWALISRAQKENTC